MLIILYYFASVPRCVLAVLLINSLGMNKHLMGMARAVRVRKADAERVRLSLSKAGLVDNSLRVQSARSFVYIPIKYASDGELGRIARMGLEIVKRSGMRKAKRAAYAGAIKAPEGGGLPDAARGYDAIGSIVVIDARTHASALRMARMLMRSNKNIKTVLAKAGPVSGRYRTRSYTYVAGRRTFQAQYKENGCTFRLDVRKAFFSPRLAFERGRISAVSKDGENVMVMFAGVGPYAIEIARAHKNSKIVAIELNRSAYSYMLENIRINKVQNVEPRLGDVGKIAADYSGFADRIVMPLPKDSYRFMQAALRAAKRRCIVHYYAFGSKDHAVDEHVVRISGLLKRMGVSMRVVSSRTVRPYSASEIEVVIDFEMKKKGLGRGKNSKDG